MALALYKFTLNLNLIGERDATRVKSYEIESVGADVATQRTNAQAAVVSMLASFGNVSGAHVQGYSLNEHWYDSDATPSGLPNLYEEAVVVANLDVGGGKKARVTIPAPADEIFVGNSGETQQIDESDAVLNAHISLFKTGQPFTLSDLEHLTDPPNILGSSVRSVKSGKTY